MDGYVGQSWGSCGLPDQSFCARMTYVRTYSSPSEVGSDGHRTCCRIASGGGCTCGCFGRACQDQGRLSSGRPAQKCALLPPTRHWDGTSPPLTRGLFHVGVGFIMISAHIFESFRSSAGLIPPPLQGLCRERAAGEAAHEAHRYRHSSHMHATLLPLPPPPSGAVP